jgi:hypothetical protein
MDGSIEEAIDDAQDGIDCYYGYEWTDAVINVDSYIKNNISKDQWKTEKQIERNIIEPAFDEFWKDNPYFTIKKQVIGYPIQPRPGVEIKKGRIDRLFIPRSEVIKLGWKFGAFGVELKYLVKGRAICQAEDYSRMVWQLPYMKVVLDYVFCFPLGKLGGPLASIMAQNKIGGCVDSNNTMTFRLGDIKCFSYNRYNDKIKINKKAERVGKKSCSR